MTALDQLEDSFPHGSLEGYRRGCRTNHCPAPVTCTTFRTRYVGDWRFRSRVDAGWTAAQIVAAELVEAERARVAEKAARAAERQQARNVKRRVPKAPKPRKPPREDVWTDAEIARLRELNAKGLLDVDIAPILGRSNRAIGQKRYALGIKGNHRASKPITHGTYAGYAAGCRDAAACPADPTCLDKARQYWRDKDHAYRAGMTVAEYRERKDAA